MAHASGAVVAHGHIQSQKGKNNMGHFLRRILSGIALIAAGYSAPILAAGDLLVAPTRLVLEDNSGGEVILSNRGNETATYRTSILLKKMLPDGRFEDVTQPSVEQQAIIDMVSYAPRRVVLAPGQTQTVRLGVRMPAELAAGEYRVHMLFRAIPTPAQPAEATPQNGLSIALTPIYGVSIPVITRKGAVYATVGIENVRAVRAGKENRISVDLTRSGNRSIYGTLKVFKPGQGQPLAIAKGVAVYTDLNRRTVSMAIPDAVQAQAKGPVIVRFNEDGDGKNKLSAEVQANL
jgi:hypothetical protein